METQATVKRSQGILQKIADQEANFAAPTSNNETTVFVRNIPYEVTSSHFNRRIVAIIMTSIH